MNSKKLLKEFGDFIRSYRENKGLSQEELGFECDLYRTQISEIERGLKNIKLTTLIKLVKVLNIPIDALEKFKIYHEFYPVNKNNK